MFGITVHSDNNFEQMLPHRQIEGEKVDITTIEHS